MRLVDAEAKGLLMELFTYRRYTGIDEAPIETAIDAIHKAPTVDAVQVVRCKDCIHWFPHTQCGYDEDNDEYHDYCGLLIPDDDYYAYTRKPDDYCSYGERREDGEA